MVSIHFENFLTADSNSDILELSQGDYIDPWCRLESFPTKRSRSINELIRQRVVQKVVIRHSLWEDLQTKVVRIPGEVYKMFTHNKSYLKQFSKDEVDHFLKSLLPGASDSTSEKQQHILTEALTFKLKPPHSLLVKEGSHDCINSFTLVQGELRVFKGAHARSHSQEDNAISVEDKIAQGFFGNQIARL